MAIQFEMCERKAVRVRRMSALTKALIETVASGKALHITNLNGLNVNSFRASVYVSCKREGLRVKVRKQEDGTFIAWAERHDEAQSFTS